MKATSPILSENGRRRQKGRLRSNWRSATDSEAELTFDYRAAHKYDHQGNQGIAHLHRGIRLLLHYAGSRPRYSGKKIHFKLHLDPGENWHACLKWQPQIEGAEKKIETGCHFSGSSPWDRKRVTFLEEATAFTSPHRADLTGIVLGALERSKQDLAALRVYDLDEDHGQKDNQHTQGWTLAAGLPSYVGLYGRDALTASWQSLMLSQEMTIGAAVELAKSQGNKVNDWRDEQPGKIVHELHTTRCQSSI